MSRIVWFVSTLACLLVACHTAAQVPNNNGKAMPRQGTNQQPANQPATNQPAANQRLAANVPVMKPPGQPAWHPLPDEHEKYLTQVLNYWEFQAAKVNRYSCKFTRWEYDSIKLPNDPQIAATISEGSIQYASPDKGLFKVEHIHDVVMINQKPNLKGGQPRYVARPEVLDEHWICDGKSIYEVSGRNKQIIERRLPPDMQGKQIAQGPLPFLFAAKAQTMREQYWIRVVVPPPIKGKFMLEAIPKRQQEAADFTEIRIVITDDQEFMPEALLLYHRGGGRSNYEFQERKKNWNMLPEMLNPFHQQFFKPALKDGWKLVQEPFQPEGAAPAARAIGTAPLQPANGINTTTQRQAVRQLPVGTKR